jgi:predicted NBD/HSP70 family sugar kinase
VNDREELRALLQRYARAVDNRDIDALTTLFHPEAVIIGSGGSQALDEWLATMRAPRAFPQSMHVIADPLIAPAKDGGSADLDSYAVVFQLSDPASGAADLTLGIRYLDHAVVHGGAWVFLRRQATTLWMR